MTIKCYLCVVLICISLNRSKVEHLFIYLLTIYFFACEVPIYILHLLFYWLVFLFIYRSSLFLVLFLYWMILCKYHLPISIKSFHIKEAYWIKVLNFNVKFIKIYNIMIVILWFIIYEYSMIILLHSSVVLE